MKTITFLRLVFSVAVSLTISACAVGGDVVKVTTVKNSQLDDLKEMELAKLEEIKKNKETQDIDPHLSNVIEATPHFSVYDYLAQNPEARGGIGGDYNVGGYDVLSITVYEEPDLSRDAARVSRDGYISFPLIGRIMVNNLSTSEIEKLISLKLAEQEYLLDAHVSVMVIEYNSRRFLILGAVKNPGAYSLQAQECVLDGITRAGGIDFDRAGKKFMIIRNENVDGVKERKIIIDIDLQGLLNGKNQVSNIYLKDKDNLFIPQVEHFYIIGQVKNPGSYPLNNSGTTLVETISMAGGFTPTASRNRTRIIRVEDGAEKIIQVKVDAITDSGKKIQDVIIKPNDIIVVPESFF